VDVADLEERRPLKRPGIWKAAPIALQLLGH
jgi:hypothetical protein